MKCATKKLSLFLKIFFILIEYYANFTDPHKIGLWSSTHSIDIKKITTVPVALQFLTKIKKIPYFLYTAKSKKFTCKFCISFFFRFLKFIKTLEI